MACLRGTHEIFNLDEHTATIGRTSASCTIVLPSRSISKRHASIDLAHDGHSALITDLGSLNGTYVNGHRIQQHLLEDGDTVRFGFDKSSYRFETGKHFDREHGRERDDTDDLNQRWRNQLRASRSTIAAGVVKEKSPQPFARSPYPRPHSQFHKGRTRPSHLVQSQSQQPMPVFEVREPPAPLDTEHEAALARSASQRSALQQQQANLPISHGPGLFNGMNDVHQHAPSPNRRHEVGFSATDMSRERRLEDLIARNREKEIEIAMMRTENRVIKDMEIQRLRQELANETKSVQNKEVNEEENDSHHSKLFEALGKKIDNVAEKLDNAIETYADAGEGEEHESADEDFSDDDDEVSAEELNRSMLKHSRSQSPKRLSRTSSANPNDLSRMVSSAKLRSGDGHSSKYSLSKSAVKAEHNSLLELQKSHSMVSKSVEEDGKANNPMHQRIPRLPSLKNLGGNAPRATTRPLSARGHNEEETIDEAPQGTRRRRMSMISHENMSRFHHRKPLTRTRSRSVLDLAPIDIPKEIEEKYERRRASLVSQTDVDLALSHSLGRRASILSQGLVSEIDELPTSNVPSSPRSVKAILSKSSIASGVSRVEAIKSNSTNGTEANVDNEVEDLSTDIDHNDRPMSRQTSGEGYDDPYGMAASSVSGDEHIVGSGLEETVSATVQQTNAPATLDDIMPALKETLLQEGVDTDWDGDEEFEEKVLEKLHIAMARSVWLQKGLRYIADCIDKQTCEEKDLKNFFDVDRQQCLNVHNTTEHSLPV